MTATIRPLKARCGLCKSSGLAPVSAETVVFNGVSVLVQEICPACDGTRFVPVGHRMAMPPKRRAGQ